MESPKIGFLSPNPRIVAQVLGALEGFAVTVKLTDGATFNGIISDSNDEVGTVVMKSSPMSNTSHIFPVEMIVEMEIC